MKRIITLLLICALYSCAEKEYLVRVSNPLENEFAYVNHKGDTIIPFYKYSHGFTDTIFDIGFVNEYKKGIIGINNKGKELFEVFNYDNGPDYISDGLFRILQDTKIGYADEKGNIIITPQYYCAFPFVDGKAKVANKCRETKEGEHTVWKSEEWFYIDKRNRKIETE